MDYAFAHPDKKRRLTALAVTVGVHVAMLAIWHASRPAPVQEKEGRRMEFWFVEPAVREPEARPSAPPRLPTVRTRTKPNAVTVVRTAPQVPSAIPASVPPSQPAETAAETAADAPRGVSAEDMLRQARGDIGSIDREMRKQSPKGMVRAPVDTPHKRMQRGIALAAELARPAWYEAPKVKEIIDPGQYGRKRYRVTTALGTYCVTQESNQSPGAGGLTGSAPKQKYTNCPEHEQPATTQD